MLCAFDIEAPPLTSYGQLCTLFYDADKPVAPDAEVAWYAQRLPQQAGPLLELMCGSGRLLVPLVSAGLKLHGVDSSAAMLGSCEARPCVGLTGRFRCYRVRLGRVFAVKLLLWRSLCKKPE